jgi:hypothetical protein
LCIQPDCQRSLPPAGRILAETPANGRPRNLFATLARNLRMRSPKMRTFEKNYQEGRIPLRRWPARSFVTIPYTRIIAFIPHRATGSKPTRPPRLDPRNRRPPQNIRTVTVAQVRFATICVRSITQMHSQPIEASASMTYRAEKSPGHETKVLVSRRSDTWRDIFRGRLGARPATE